MARARAGEQQRSRSKAVQIQEITLGITKFQELLTAINDFGREGFPYRDAAQSKAELQFRECLRHTFGERSQEFQNYRNFKLRSADKAEVAQSIAVVKGLIHTLEDRKLELQGLKPPPKPDPVEEAKPTNTARLVLVSPAAPTTVTTQATSPMTVAVAMTTNVGPSVSPVPTTPASKPAAPEPQLFTPTPTFSPAPTPAPTPPPTPTPSPVAPEPSAFPIPAVIQTPSPPPATDSVVQPTPSVPEATVETRQSAPSPPIAPVSASPPTQPPVTFPPQAVNSQGLSSAVPDSVRSAMPDLPLEKPSVSPSNARLIESALDQDPLHLVRKVCLRLHSVARQLRLRRDDRPTLEVKDDHDLQDLLCALLKVEFDEVATDEWTPPYTGGVPRTTLFVNSDKIAVVAKKTGPGLTTKELANQVAADSSHYRAQGRCSTLFCFMYDPEGRIGSPKRLETTLTSVSEHCRVEVLVAPK